jgi:hypothetical protein
VEQRRRRGQLGGWIHGRRREQLRHVSNPARQHSTAARISEFARRSLLA